MEMDKQKECLTNGHEMTKWAWRLIKKVFSLDNVIVKGIVSVFETSRMFLIIILVGIFFYFEFLMKGL